MEIKDVKKTIKSKSKVMSIRVSEDSSLWMKKNEISPQKVFNLAIAELMKK